MDFSKNLFLICLIYILISSSVFQNYCYADDIDLSEDIELNSLETSVLPSSIPTLNSRAAIILEKSTGAVLFGKNENEIRKMASTTKIMTGIVVLENVKDLSQIITVSKRASGIGGSRLGLTANAKISVKDLLYGLLLCSGNDSAVALAEFVGGNVEGFADLMNEKANLLGLKNTHFVTPHGLDNDNHYTTAYELALLSKYALQNETFTKIVSTKNHTVYINNSPKNIHNTNELLGFLDGVYGIKTGFTNGANRCLVTSCKRGDLDIICVVLGADTKKYRAQDSIKLIEYAFSNFEMFDISTFIEKNFSEWKLNNCKRFFINKGISNNVDIYLSDIPYSSYPINKSHIKNLKADISCTFSFEAPLLQNTKIGSLNCYVDDLKICELDIYTANTILKKNLPFYFNSFFKNYPSYLESIF